MDIKQMTKQIKLTEAQQEVVNLMAEGWTLELHFGIGHHKYARLQKGGASQDVHCGVIGHLEKKEVIFLSANTYRTHVFSLTDSGKTLVRDLGEKSSEIWWLVRGYNNEITRIPCKSSTDSFITTENGCREAKSSSYHSYHPSREAAVEAIRTKLSHDVLSAEEALKRAKAVLAAFEKREKL